jgi:hypothetical protein
MSLSTEAISSCDISKLINNGLVEGHECHNIKLVAIKEDLYSLKQQYPDAADMFVQCTKDIDDCELNTVVEINGKSPISWGSYQLQVCLSIRKYYLDNDNDGDTDLYCDCKLEIYEVYIPIFTRLTNMFNTYVLPSNN